MKEYGNDAVEQANKTSRIKLYITILILVALVVVGYFISDQTDGYPMNIHTKSGSSWTYEIQDTSVLNVKSQPVLEDGKYKMTLEGLKEGETDIYMERIQDGSDKVLEKRTYHMSVNEKLSIHQKSVDREVM